MFAGAYNQDILLEKGSARQTIRIPFTVSQLFELGIQRATASLSIDDHVIAADTGRVRIAECHVADEIRIGFLSDSSGLLEDVLEMTDAVVSPITDRGLLTGDLNAYDVIVIGSGSFRTYPSFVKIKDRFEDYVRQGGSITILGQPDDWPIGAMAASVTPATELVSHETLKNLIPEARILAQPYKITEKGLLSDFFRQTETTPAIVAPAEKVYVTPSGATLLSVTRLGDGQIIYCGFPVLEMASKLNIEAIHLFANILNY